MSITKLREHREGLGLSLRQVAASVGVSPATLSRIETGDQTPGRETARAIYGRYSGALPIGLIYDATFEEAKHGRKDRDRVD